jgi:hypothetical protein
MNSGTGERLSAMPQPACASAALAINAAQTIRHRIRRH